MSKDSLVKGTVILMAAAFVARFLGVIQRIPLKALLDDKGMATYSIAYNVYFALLIVATAGIPSALSKLISEKTELGRHEEADVTYRAAVWFALTAGVVTAILLYAAAPLYAEYVSQDPDSALAIQALAPALLLFPLIAVLRGYFQGRQRMMSNGLSQIVEQILRVVTAVLLAYLAMRFGFGRRWAAAGASFGGVMGGVGAALVMLYAIFKLRRSDKLDPAGAVDGIRPSVSGYKSYSLKGIYASIFRLAVPISLISLAVPLINFIDSSTVIPLLKGQLGYEQAKTVLGILGGRAQSLAGIPIILAIALSQSAVPVISSAYARGDVRELSRKSSLALRLGLLTGLPMVLGLVTAGRSVNGLLFADTNGTGLISLCVAASLFQIMMMTSGAILMGIGHMKAPTLNVFIGLAVKLLGSFVLSRWWGIYGIVTATLLCFAVTMLLNLHALRQEVDFQIMKGRWLRLLLLSTGLCAVGFALAWGAGAWLQFPWMRLSYLVQAAVVGGIVTSAYVLSAVWLGILGPEDLASLPGRVKRYLPKAWLRTAFTQGEGSRD